VSAPRTILPAVLLAAVAAGAVGALHLLTSLPGVTYQLAAGAGVAAAILGTCFLLRSGAGALAHAAGLLTAFLLPLNGVRLSGWLAAADVTLVLAAGLGLLQSTTVRVPVRIPGAFVVGVVGLVIGGAVGSVASPQPVTGLTNFARFLLTAVASVVIVLQWSPGPAQIRAMFRAWLAGNAVNVAAALVEHPSVPGQRPAGLTTHPNALGLVCVLSLAIGIALYATGGRTDRLVALASAAVAGVGVVISGSRAAVIGCLVVVLVRTALGRSWRLIALIVAAAGLGAIVWTRMPAMSGGTTALGRLLNPGTGVGDSDAVRLAHLRAARDSFVAHPVFGSGFANATDAHNVLLQVVVAAGLIGLTGFLAICWTMLRGLWRPTAPDTRWLSLLPVAFLTDGMFSNNLWDRYIWLSLAVGIYASCRAGTSDVPDPLGRPVPSTRPARPRRAAPAPPPRSARGRPSDVRPKETV
jgi:hypothetical protein